MPAVLHAAVSPRTLELVRHVYTVRMARGDGNIGKLFRGAPAPLLEGAAVLGLVQQVDQPVGCVAHLVDERGAQSLVAVYHLRAARGEYTPQ